ncbi:MAG: ABC transporter permease [Chloroflexota bacterium]
MQKTLAIAMTDLRIFLSDRANLVGLLLIPSVLTIVLGFVGSRSLPTLDIVVIDQDETTQSETFIENLRAINDRFVVGVANDNTAIDGFRQDVVNGRYDALVILPSGFEDAIQNFEPFDVPFYSNENPTSPSAIQPAISSLIGRLNGSIVASQVGGSIVNEIGATVDATAIYETAQAILAQNPVEINFIATEIDNDGEQSGFNQSVPGMGTMFVLFTILGGMALFVRERQQWTLQRMVVMPVRRGQIIGGKIIAYFVLGMLQYAVVFGIGYAFGLDLLDNWLGLILIAMAFSLAATALTFAIATFVRTEGQAGQLTTLLALGLAAIGGAWWPLDTVPEFMRIIGHISPIAWAMDGFQDLIWYNRGLVDILPEIGILLLIALGFFVVGIFNFKYE